MSFNNRQSIDASLGFDYTQLDQLLAARKWKEADSETEKKLLKVMGKESWFDLDRDDLENLSKEDLRIMDSLWVKYSNGRFGFSVQKEICIACGGTPDGVYTYELDKKFGDRIGWRKDGSWVRYSELTFNTSAPKGHLPAWGLGAGGGIGFWFASIFSRL